MDLASLQIRLARSENLPVLPQAVSSVLRLADDPNVPAKELERVIERDPAITAKILRVANSAYYGSSNVPTIGRAINFLGMNTIRSLMVGVAFQQMISSRMSSRRFNKVEYWRHSLGAATANRILGRMKMPAKAEELYCAGMMHDVGLLIMERFMADELDSALNVATTQQRPICDVEQEMLGFDHCQVGAILAKQWGFGGMILHAISYHRNPVLDGDYYETTCFTAAADIISYQCGFTNNLVAEATDIDPVVAEAVGIPVQQFEAIRDVVVDEVMKAQEAFHIS